MKWLTLLCLILLQTLATYAQKQKLTILGSSTAEGVGASVKDSSWVGRLSNYYRRIEPVVDTVYNLAKRGKDPYFAMPSSYIPPANRPYPNKDSNVTRAVSLKGKFVIVSFASNNYDIYSFAEIHSTLKTIKDSANKAGLICYIATSQPRTGFTAEGRLKLKQVKDSIIKWFGSWAINFFDPVVDPSDLSILPVYRYSKDAIHLNDLGHRVLFEQVLAKNIFDTPGYLFGILTVKKPDCYNGTGSISVKAYGGTPPYKYSIDGGVSYQTSNIFSVKAGSYTVRIQDSKGKTKNLGCTVSQPAKLTATSRHGTILCYGGTTRDTVFASGGTSPYQYSVNNGAYQTSRYFTLPAGNYIFSVRDSRGCITNTAQISIVQPPLLVLSVVSAKNPTCNGASDGSISVSATGGTGAYLYSINSGVYQSGGLFTNLKAGTYTLRVKDGNACIKSKSVSLTNPSNACLQGSDVTPPDSGQWEIQVAPNPSASDFSLVAHLPDILSAELCLLNSSGMPVFRKQVVNNQQIRFGSNLPPGMYFLQARSGKEIKVIKVIKR